MNKRNANVLHSHEGRRLHHGGDVLFKKEKYQVHAISRSLDTGELEDSELSGVGAGRRIAQLNRGQIYEKLSALRTGCMFLFLLLVGMCATSFGDLGSRLVSEFVLEKEVNCLPPGMNCITESIMFFSTSVNKEYAGLEILQDDADDSQRYLDGAFEPISDRAHRGVSTNSTCRAIAISFRLESLLDDTREPRLSTLGLEFSAWGKISDPIQIFESGHRLDNVGQAHQTWKSVDPSDLDGTVPCAVGDVSLPQLIIQRLICGDLLMMWNLCMFVPVFLTAFLVLCCSTTYHLLHALYLVWSSVQTSFTMACNVTNDSRLCLLLRVRVAVGIKRIERMPYCELISLHNSHAPLLYLEASRQLSGTTKLCRIMKDASLSDLSYLNNASDIISRHVEQVLSTNLKYVKQQRLWERISRKFNWSYFDDRTIERFQLLFLVLSVFETNDEDIKTVILYGVPGLPSISLSVTATYAEIRAKILQRAPHIRNFYFIARGRIIYIEDTVIDWGYGHLVLNVHTSRDLPGGSMQGSSDNKRKNRNRNKRTDLQRLLVSDASGDEDSDDSISRGVSDSESFHDSDSSWDLQKNKQQDRKRQRNRDARKSNGAEGTPQSDASGDEVLDGSAVVEISDSESFRDSDF